MAHRPVARSCDKGFIKVLEILDSLGDHQLLKQESDTRSQ